MPDFRNNQYRVKQEKILRTSLTRNLWGDHLVEVGVEAAINNFDKLFTNEDYVAGAYSLSVNDDVTVKENRYELFANHTYNISPKMVLQSSVIGEFSKISSVTVPLAGANITRSKNFSFLKPRLILNMILQVAINYGQPLREKSASLIFKILLRPMMRVMIYCA